MISAGESKNQDIFSPTLKKFILAYGMVSQKDCHQAAQAFLDGLKEKLHKLPKDMNQKDLAKAAGVSAPTITDWKAGRKLDSPEFRKIFAVAYVLLGFPPCSFIENEILIAKIREALKKDTLGMLKKLVEIIRKNIDLEELRFIDFAISDQYEKNFPPEDREIADF